MAQVLRRREAPVALAAAGMALAWFYLLSVWVPRDNVRHSVSAPLREVAVAAGWPPMAGLDLSEPVRGAAAFALGRELEALRDTRGLAAWLAGSPAVAIVQGREEGSPEELQERLQRDPVLTGRFAVIGRAKLHHEVLLFLVAPERLPEMIPVKGGGHP